MAEGSLPKVRADDRQTTAGKAFETKGPTQVDRV